MAKIELTEDAAATAVYLAKLERMIPEIREAKTLEEIRDTMTSFMLEHYQHELDMAAIRLRGGKPRDRWLAEEAEAIKARIAEIQAGT